MSSWYWNVGWLPSLLAVVGNSLVIYLILSRRILRTTANRFVLSLAIADFSVGACFYPGQAICHFVLTSCHLAVRDDIAVLMIYASVCNLFTMTLDHYIAIIRPLRYTFLMTPRRVTVVTAAAWIIPLSVYFIPSICVSVGLFRVDFKVSVIIWSTLFEVIPCLVLLLATVQTLITSRKHSRRDRLLNTQLRHNQPNIKRPRSASSTKVITTVVVTFLMCYAVEVYSSFCHFTSLCTMHQNLYNVVRFLVITNSAINPIAYALLKRDIKMELHKMFRQKPVWKRRSSERTTSV